MKPSLQVRLSQHLALTPQLQQSIRLLQLSTLELHQEVEQMLATNPLLDTEDEFTVSAPELAANAPAESGTSASMTFAVTPLTRIILVRSPIRPSETSMAAWAWSSSAGASALRGSGVR